jgi:hypothetical protein
MIDINKFKEIIYFNCKYCGIMERCYIDDNNPTKCKPSYECEKYLDDKTKTVILQYYRKNRISKLKEL